MFHQRGNWHFQWCQRWLLPWSQQDVQFLFQFWKNIPVSGPNIVSYLSKANGSKTYWDHFWWTLRSSHHCSHASRSTWIQTEISFSKHTQTVSYFLEISECALVSPHSGCHCSQSIVFCFFIGIFTNKSQSAPGSSCQNKVIVESDLLVLPWTEKNFTTKSKFLSKRLCVAKSNSIKCLLLVKPWQKEWKWKTYSCF